jgi:D-amino-acid dehydrogenase
VTTDVLVIGGGAVGVAVAYELAREGAAVTVVERGREVGQGSSGGSAGLLAPSHAATLANPAALLDGLRWMGRPASPFYLRPRPQIVPWLLRFTRAALDRRRVGAATALLRTLSRDSLRLHGALTDAGIPTTLERRGVIYTYETEAGYAHARAGIAGARELGLTAEPLDIAAARELEPALAGTLAGAVYVAEEAHLDSLQFVRAMAAAASDAGADVRLDTEVLRFRRAGDRIAGVDTTGGRFAAGTVVLAAGVWSRHLADGLGLSVPLEGAKGYHVELAATEADPRLPVYMHEARVVATPYPGRLRLAGTLELSGLDDSVDARRVQALRESSARHLATLDGREPQRVWRGFRPTPPDGLPLLGRSRRVANLLVATGHAMTGVALAPVTARIVADLVAGRTPGYDLSRMDPDRFTRTG